VAGVFRGWWLGEEGGEVVVFISITGLSVCIIGLALAFGRGWLGVCDVVCVNGEEVRLEVAGQVCFLLEVWLGACRVRVGAYAP
jgi:hypothetical protein